MKKVILTVISITISLVSFATPPTTIEYNSLLFQAAKQGNSQTVKALLEKGANPDAQSISNEKFNLDGFLKTTQSKSTPLMLAAYTGRLEIVATFLNVKVNVNAQDSEGQTALTYAILGDHNWPHAPLPATRKKVIELLLNAGANPHLQDNNGLDAAYYYSCVAGLIPGFNETFEKDQTAASEDSIYKRMKN